MDPENIENLDEDERDLLRLQKEFFEAKNSGRKPSNIRLKKKDSQEKVQKQKVTFLEPEDEKVEGEKLFTENNENFLDFQREEDEIVSFVKERFIGYFEVPDRCVPFSIEENETISNENSRKKGFPEIYDLSKWWKIPEGGKIQEEMKIPEEKKIPEEMKIPEGEKIPEELKILEEMKIQEEMKIPEEGKIQEEMKIQEGEKIPEELEILEEDTIPEEGKIQEEMKIQEGEKIPEELEILEEDTIPEEEKPSSSSETIPLRDVIKLEDENWHGLSIFAKEFNRRKFEDFQMDSKKQRKTSKFASERRKNLEETEKGVQFEGEKEVPSMKTPENDAIENLEVIDPDDDPEYSRLAMDAVHLDFATKCIRNTLPRQEMTIIRLFDALKTPPINFNKNSPDFSILAKARDSIEQIKELYLEEILVSENKRIWRFASDVNPIVNGAWSFVPIRRVLDAIQTRGKLIADDIEIVQLALLWSILLLRERETLFNTFSQPSEIYCRLAEIYLMEPEMFKDDLIGDCVESLLENFLLPKARKNLLSLRRSHEVAALDAFLPFFEELLQRFDEYSMGDENFARILLIGIYLNGSLTDSLIMAQDLWTPARKIVRQFLLNKKSNFNRKLLSEILDRIKNSNVIEERESAENFPAYEQLLAMYAAAIRDGSVNAERNPIVFTLASNELGQFIQRWTSNDQRLQQIVSEEKRREIGILVNLLRTSVKGKLNF